jgi:hypothetical protein
MVVKGNYGILDKEAANIRLTKQLELGACDLFSLEPVDFLYRPLRIKDYLKEDDIPTSFDDEESEDFKKKNEVFIL